MGKFSKDKRDIFYRLAKQQGYRARSAYKLIQINEKFDIFKGVTKAVDLCSAPGSWSQVMSEALRENGPDTKIINVDIQVQAPIPGVIQIQGDITHLSTAQEIIKYCNGEKADLVVCDGAPDVTGLHDLDEFIQGKILLHALSITTYILKLSGCFVAKIFRGKDIGLMFSILKMFFQEVIVVKPRSSRNSSIESFVVCKNYQPPDDFSFDEFDSICNKKCDDYFKTINKEANCIKIPFVACGDLDGLDSDKSYILKLDTNSYEYSKPAQNPINPPYEKAVQMKRSQELPTPLNE